MSQMEREFLRAVHAQPVLWDRKYKTILSNLTKVEEKAKAWQVIASKFSTTQAGVLGSVPTLAEDCAAKFHAMRQKQRRESIHERKMHAQGIHAKPRWELWDEAQFIRENQIPRKKKPFPNNAEGLTENDTYLDSDEDNLLEENQLDQFDSNDPEEEYLEENLHVEEVSTDEIHNYASNSRCPPESSQKNVISSTSGRAPAPSANNLRIRRFCSYLASELELMSQNDSEEVIEGIQLRLIQVKKNTRNKKRAMASTLKGD